MEVTMCSGAGSSVATGGFAQTQSGSKNYWFCPDTESSP